MSQPVHLEIQRHRKNPYGLLRTSQRVDGKVTKKTLGRITGVSYETLKLIQASLQGKVMMQGDMTICSSREYGASQLFIGLARELELDKTIYSRTSETWVRLLLGMIIGRILFQGSKLSLTRLHSLTSLWTQLGVEEESKDVNQLYAAMDRLLKRKDAIEKKLTQRHLKDGEILLYDITSSYLEGSYENSQLVVYGYNRDKKKGHEQIVIGLLCNREGCPIGVEVFRGNTKDAATVEEQILRVTKSFGIERLIFVGDRGMISYDSFEKMPSLSENDRQHIQSISALTHAGVKRLCEENYIFEKNTRPTFPMELKSSEIPNRRIVLCYNPVRAEENRQTRDILLDKTEEELKVVADRKRKVDNATVGIRVGKVINRFHMGKFFDVYIENGKLSWQRRDEDIEREARFDGLFAIISDIKEEKMASYELVESYKRLTEVEQAFRTMKSQDLDLRPIYHKTDDRIRSHVFLCMLSYYLLWHFKKRLQAFWHENKTGTSYTWTLTQSIEELKSIRENSIEIEGVMSTIYTRPSADQERMIEMVKAKKI